MENNNNIDLYNIIIIKYYYNNIDLLTKIIFK